MLDADCPGSCKIALLNNAELYSVGSLGGTDRLGGKVALEVRNSTLHGLALETTVGVTVKFITSRCGNCTISTLTEKMVIVNSQFEPALNETLQGSVASCEDLQQRLGVCDLKADCSDFSPTSGRTCSCPFGVKKDFDDDGSRLQCVDLCDLAQKGIVSADSSTLSRTNAKVTESANLTFSFSDSDMNENVSVWLVPKNGMRNATLSALSSAVTGVKLVETGVTGTGLYELQLRSKAEGGNSGTICPLVDALQVQCTPGKSAADAPGMPCMPVVNITAASVRITSSSGEVLFDGILRAPIVAGDKLKVEVEVRDIDGKLVTRSTFGLAMELKGKLNGDHPVQFTPPDGGSSSFEVTISEMWIKEREKVELRFKVKSEVVYTLTIELVGRSSTQIAMGITAAVLVGALVVVMFYIVFTHGAKAMSVVLSLVTKEGKMAWATLGEGFDMAADYCMFYAIQAAMYDTEKNRRNVEPVYISTMVSLVVSTLISLLALAMRFRILVVQIQRRRRELTSFGQRKGYLEQLKIKIEDAERQCKQIYIGIALALFEQAPMDIIGIFFLHQQYEAPWLPIASVFSSGVMLGMKVAAITTLPYWWTKLKKWQASARPVGKDTDLGTELAMKSVEGDDTSNGEDDIDALALALHELRSPMLHIVLWAEALSKLAKTPADALTNVVTELEKMDHKLALYGAVLSAPMDPEPKPKPKPSLIEVIWRALYAHSCATHGARRPTVALRPLVPSLHG